MPFIFVIPKQTLFHCCSSQCLFFLVFIVLILFCSHPFGCGNLCTFYLWHHSLLFDTIMPVGYIVKSIGLEGSVVEWSKGQFKIKKLNWSKKQCQHILWIMCCTNGCGASCNWKPFGFIDSCFWGHHLKKATQLYFSKRCPTIYAMFVTICMLC